MNSTRRCKIKDEGKGKKEVCETIYRAKTTMETDLTPRVLVRAYCAGLFPMGEEETGRVRWYAPDPRGILPLEDFHVPTNLGRLVRQGRFRVTFDQAFDRVIACCADRERTWITPRILKAYKRLHRAGPAHSVEAWTAEGALAGGLYGVALGGAFFGESMFFRETNASKVALVHLVRRLRRRNYRLLDTQYGNAHLEQFGGIEISREEYQRRLDRALRAEVAWGDTSREETPEDFSYPPSEIASSDEASYTG